LFTYYFLFFDWDERYFYTRAILGVRCSSTKQLDHNLTFHKLVAYALALLTAVHTIAHLFNLEHYNQSHQATDSSLPAVLSKMHLQGSKWLNPIHSNQTTVEYVAFTTILGLIITLAFILVITSSTEFICRNYFELFWYTHQLFFIYFAGLIIHGIIKPKIRTATEQSMAEVQPYHCDNSFLALGMLWPWPFPNLCSPPSSQSWKWFFAPMILYVFEWILRVWRAQQKVVVMHPACMVELQMQKGFCMEVGQYTFVNCPAISPLEWHPFTLTSAPKEDFSIHIQVAGNWTEHLIDTFQLETPRIEVNGPFGMASEDVFQYEVAMLVGAGIGITPFASILKSIWYKFQQADQTLKTKKIYFYWLCWDTGAFQKMGDIANNVAFYFNTTTDTVMGLRHKTIFGRLMWNMEFAAVSVVSVFLCGPEALAKSLQKSCHQHSSLDPRKVKFYFNKENF
uniref:NADPH oxidase 1 n=1 Tax=Cyanoderma ruficeps TaxID=181631 RepID=A0A8C3R9T3_9PASS